VRLHYPEEYPVSPLLVEITQSSLPPNSERKLNQQCNDKVGTFANCSLLNCA
jgi:hypothetical protein